MKRGKRYVEAAKLVDRATLYDAADALAIVKKAAVAKFDETVEVHIRTGHGAGYHKNLRKGIVEQKHYRHIDKIVGDKDCGEQTLRLFKQANTIRHFFAATRSI